MGKDLEFFPFFIDDFLTATQAWPSERVGAYWLLLCYQWKHLGVPGDDIEALAVIIHEPIKNTRKLWAKLQVKFPRTRKGFQNKRMEQVRAAVLAKVDEKRNRTKSATEAAAAARRKKKQDRDAQRQRSVTDSVTDAVTPPYTDGNLKGTAKDKGTNPPLNSPPLSGGEPQTSVTDGLTEKSITRRERQAAEDSIKKFGCPHDPECETHEACVGRIVGVMRAQEHAGLHSGVREVAV